MASINPFSTNNYDLGIDKSIGIDKDSVSNELLHSAYSSTAKCYVCGNTAKYKVVAKDPRYETATIQNGLYVCKHCLSIAPISPNQYAIKELE